MMDSSFYCNLTCWLKSILKQFKFLKFSLPFNYLAENNIKFDWKPELLLAHHWSVVYPSCKIIQYGYHLKNAFLIMATKISKITFLINFSVL